MGFTLIEVVVALAVSGLVLLLARAVFSTTIDASRALGASRAALDREANARRSLQAAFLSLEVGAEDGGGPFAGRPDRMEFGAWLQTPEAWFERRRVELVADGSKFVAVVGRREKGEGSNGEPILLADSVADVAFDYLLEPGADTKWVQEWISPVSAPLAVRLRITHRTPPAVDTLLLLIKERG